jgi:hypothetical protein
VLTAKEETHEAARVRAEVVQALQGARTMMEPFLTVPWDAYCKNMALPGTWGGARAAAVAPLLCPPAGVMCS